jgi:hypothetical protein
LNTNMERLALTVLRSVGQAARIAATQAQAHRLLSVHARTVARAAPVFARAYSVSPIVHAKDKGRISLSSLSPCQPGSVHVNDLVHLDYDLLHRTRAFAGKAATGPSQATEAPVDVSKLDSQMAAIVDICKTGFAKFRVGAASPGSHDMARFRVATCS